MSALIDSAALMAATAVLGLLAASLAYLGSALNAQLRPMDDAFDGKGDGNDPFIPRAARDLLSSHARSDTDA